MAAWKSVGDKNLYGIGMLIMLKVVLQKNIVR